MISFVYFDLGGVVIKDFSGTDKWQEMKNAIGISAEQNSRFDAWYDQAEKDLCESKAHFDLQFENVTLTLNDFVSRFEKNPSIGPVITEIHKKFPVGLLTNMYPGMFEAIKNRGLLPDVSWDIIIDSSIEKSAKPDPDIYKLAQKRVNASGPEILFIENTPGNITPAQKLGWQTFLYDPTHPIDSSRKLLEYTRK